MDPSDLPYQVLFFYRIYQTPIEQKARTKRIALDGRSLVAQEIRLYRELVGVSREERPPLRVLPGLRRISAGLGNGLPGDVQAEGPV